MIKSKKCKECDRLAFSKGLCQIHSKSKLISKGTGKIKNKRESTVEKSEVKRRLREIYFDYHIERCKYSDETGEPINNPNRSNICHVFAKSTHPSLQDHLENCIYLSFEHHQIFDELLFSLQFEKLEKEFKNSFKKACFIFNNLLSLCQESTNFTRSLKKYLDGRET